MSKFLQSKVEKGIATQMEDSNRLTLAGLRSLIPGNFYLMEIQPSQTGPLSGIRHCFLLLHEKSLFVLYQCHQSGIIHGEAAEQAWTCFNYLGDSKPFDNPILQNGENIQLLSALLKLPPEEFHNCILFDNECELRKIPANTQEYSVIWADQVENHFAALLPTRSVCYTPTQLEALNDIFALVSAEV